jgi:hypothetical protein
MIRRGSNQNGEWVRWYREVLTTLPNIRTRGVCRRINDSNRAIQAHYHMICRLTSQLRPRDTSIARHG